jgi:hypothetical protein
LSYKLKIKAEQRFDLEKWTETIEAVESVRLCGLDFQEVKGPKGELVRCPTSEGDAEIFIPELNEWVVVFHFNERGYASFRAPQTTSLKDPVWSAAVVLAQLLKAKIVGEEGEYFDLKTLEITRRTSAETEVESREEYDEEQGKGALDVEDMQDEEDDEGEGDAEDEEAEEDDVDEE